MKNLGKIYKEIQGLPDKSFLLGLLNNDAPRVRLLVASHCLGLNVYVFEAKEVLLNLSKNSDNPILAFEAEATISVWKEQGFLLF